MRKRLEASPFRRHAGHLGRGLALLLPIAATLWVFWWVFVGIDELLPVEGLLGSDVRGAGIAAVLVLGWIVGLLATEPGIRRTIRLGEGVLLRIPLFKLVYSVFRDFASALLVKKGFDRPVLVKLGGGFDAEVLGFVTNVDELMGRSDLIITKSGGLTVSECLARRLPMVLYSPIPGQEECNADYLLEHGCAVKARTLDVLDYKVLELLENPARLDMMRRACGTVARASAGRDVLRHILDENSARG